MSAARQVRSALRSVFDSTSRVVAELDAADAALRTPLPLSRRVGFVAVSGGSGTSSAMSSVASLLARRRSGMVLATDAAGGRSGVRRQLVDPSAATSDQGRSASPVEPDPAGDLLLRRTARSAADARQGLERTASGLYLLDLAEPGRRPPSADAWAEQVSPIARFYDLVVTDWGVRPPSMDLEDVAGTGHVLVLVSRAERRAATAAAAAIDALARSANAPRFLLALVDVGRSSDRMADGLASGLGVPVVQLPYERARVDRLTPAGRDFGAATRIAHIRLADAVMGQVLDTASAGSRMSERTNRTVGAVRSGSDGDIVRTVDQPRHGATPVGR